MSPTTEAVTVTDQLALNYHLMHPGGDSTPGDPNAALYLDGTYHLHYIVRHTWKHMPSYSFMHVTSADMLHWSWQKTTLQPSFTGHRMFSGTGFLTKEGRPAIIYNGQCTTIAIARDNTLSNWEEPYPLRLNSVDGIDKEMHHRDPDCFVIDDTYYALLNPCNPQLARSIDLKSWNWTHAGAFFRHELPDVAIGEDVSCPNFFPLGDKWMLLCISHPLGCRYYLGDWDGHNEQFVPEAHGRMNWPRAEQSTCNKPAYRDFFAPESVLTADGRRVMWAWLATLDEAIDLKSIQSLPRELSLGADGKLRIKPLRELESLRYDAAAIRDVHIEPEADLGISKGTRIAELDGDSFEVRITIERSQANRKRFGVQLFASENQRGLPVMILPEYGTLRIGTSEAPFAVSDLPQDEDVEICIFIDKYLVEVFVNDRQAAVAVHMDRTSGTHMRGYSFVNPTVFSKVEIWKLRPSNQGFLAARESRIWEPDRSHAG